MTQSKTTVNCSAVLESSSCDIDNGDDAESDNCQWCLGSSSCDVTGGDDAESDNCQWCLGSSSCEVIGGDERVGGHTCSSGGRAA